MPRGDGTGPWWARGNWNCRRGMGRGAGAGRGFGFQQMETGDELESLKGYSKNLKAEREQVLKRIASLEKTSTKK